MFARLTGGSIRARITIAFAFILLLFAGVSGNSLFSLKSSDTMFDEYREVARAASGLNQMRGDMLATRISAEAFLRYRAQEDLTLTRQRLTETFASLEATQNYVTSTEMRERLAALGAQVRDYSERFESARASVSTSTDELAAFRALGGGVTTAITEVADYTNARRDGLGPVI